jgi:DNA-binding CsgD family transcriptional regulator/tetratricopeptide (TPR) repeat protein
VPAAPNRHAARDRIVGRAPELAVLRSLVDELGPSLGSVVLLEGEPGIGKTSLVLQAAAFAAERGIGVYHGEAREYDGRKPFGVLLDAWQLDGSESALAAEVAELLGGARTAREAFDDWPAQEFRIRELLLTLLDERTTAGPVVVILEDLHWADVATLGLLHQLAGMYPAVPILLIATCRSGARIPELAALISSWLRAGAVHLLLGPLTSEACAELVRNVVGYEPTPALLARVAAAGGNPLYANEMLSVLRSEGVLRTEPDGRIGLTPGGRPSSQSLTILDRLSYLGQDACAMLSLASVFGSTFALTDLAALAGENAAGCWTKLAPAVQAEVLVEHADELRFRHELIREALYEDLPAAVRAGLHTDAARILHATGAPPALIAEHVLRGAARADPAGVDWLRAAAADTASRAPSVAADLLTECLERTDVGNPIRVEVLTDLAIVLAAAGRHSDSIAACEQALRQPQLLTRMGRLRVCLAKSLLVEGRIVEAQAQVEAALTLPALPDRERARAMAWASYPLMYLGDRVGSVAMAERAITAGRDAGDLPAQIAATLTLAHVANFEARLTDAERLARDSVSMAQAAASLLAHEGTPHLVHGLALLDSDRIADASDAFARGLKVAEGFGADSRLVLAQQCVAYLAYLRGDWDDASAEWDAGAALATETGLEWQLEPMALRGLMATYRGELEQAEDWISRAEQARAAGAPQFRLGWVRWARAGLAETIGDLDTAVATLSDAWRTCVAADMRCEFRVIGPDLARVAAATGDRYLASEVADRLEEAARRNPGLPGVGGAARRARGLAESDADLLLEALALSRQAARPLELAGCADEAATALARAGRITEATETAAKALMVYEQLGAAGTVLRSRARWRDAGLRLGVRGRRARPKSGWAALTDTEVRVARLVSERLTNPEIAAVMFLSRRTVATHVSHVLAKLAMTGRGELVAAAARGSLEQIGQNAD